MTVFRKRIILLMLCLQIQTIISCSSKNIKNLNEQYEFNNYNGTLCISFLKEDLDKNIHAPDVGVQNFIINYLKSNLKFKNVQIKSSEAACNRTMQFTLHVKDGNASWYTYPMIGITILSLGLIPAPIPGVYEIDVHLFSKDDLLNPIGNFNVKTEQISWASIYLVLFTPEDFAKAYYEKRWSILLEESRNHLKKYF